MLNKTTIVIAALENDITQNRLPVGEMIPSRAQLMRRFHCSRTVVERAVADLTDRGFLVGKQGKGTFVSAAAVPQNTVIRRVFTISSYDTKSFQQSLYCLRLDSNDLGVPVVFIPQEKADAECETLCQPDALTVFINPDFEQLPLMHYLKKRHIPMLVINREFDGFDRIYTDTLAGFRDGMKFLKSCPPAPLYVIGREGHLKYPYMTSRKMNFFRACAENSITIPPENIFFFPFENVAEAFADMRHIFRNTPIQIAVLNSDLNQPVLEFAQAAGKVPGKDFFMLAFEYIAAIADTPGVAMIRQKYDVFYSQLKSFIAGYGKEEAGSFVSAVLPEIILPIGKQPDQNSGSQPNA